MKIYTLFDGIAKEHSSVFEAKNNDVAMRVVAKQVWQSPDPDSFTVHCLGFVDRHDENVQLNVLDKVECVWDFSKEDDFAKLESLFTPKSALAKGDK